MANIYDDDDSIDHLGGIELPPLTERQRLTGFVRTFEFNEAKAAYRRWREAADSQLDDETFKQGLARAIADGTIVDFASRQVDEIARVNKLHEEFERAHREFLKVIMKDDDAPRTNYVGTDQD